NPWLFNGRRYDSEATLTYYRTRYLDSPAGRFTTRDSVGVWRDRANQGGAFTYVANNPASYIDPFGTMTTCPEICDDAFEEHLKICWRIKCEEPEAYENCIKAANANRNQRLEFSKELDPPLDQQHDSHQPWHPNPNQPWHPNPNQPWNPNSPLLQTCPGCQMSPIFLLGRR